MKKAMKKIGIVLAVLIGLIIIVVVGLIINNRVIYNSLDEKAVEVDYLTDSQLADVENVYSYLKDNTIYDGFGSADNDVVLYNRNYEFLVTSRETVNGWEETDQTVSERNVFRRTADDPQAFAQNADGTWAGTFSVHDFFDISILEQTPIFIPPQMFRYDDIGYRGIVIHEMVHAFQARSDTQRFESIHHKNNVNEKYYNDSTYNDYIKQEAKALNSIVNDDNSDVKEKVRTFLNARNNRHSDCNMTDDEISAEQDLEWLEGAARYAEYISSQGSTSPVAKGLSNISSKAKVHSDDRFYTLGMAEIIAIDKLNISDWQNKIFVKGYSLEELLSEAIS